MIENSEQIKTEMHACDTRHMESTHTHTSDERAREKFFKKSVRDPQKNEIWEIQTESWALNAKVVSDLTTNCCCADTEIHICACIWNSERDRESCICAEQTWVWLNEVRNGNAAMCPKSIKLRAHYPH